MRIPRARTYFGYRLPIRSFTYKTLTLSGGASHPLRLELLIRYPVLNPAHIAAYGLASSAFARRYSQNLV